MSSYNQRCRHRSHLWRLRCFRRVIFDNVRDHCPKHYHGCKFVCTGLDPGRDWMIW